MKHNNQITNSHFRKYWQQHVVTWFDQPAKKAARRSLRATKAKKAAPRPVALLRPIVRGQTLKYGAKARLGRGFSLEELRAAGISKKEALGIGIAVDHRRTNLSEEGFQKNVERLLAYRKKLVVFPRNPTSKRVKKGDATRDQLQQATQLTDKVLMPLSETDVKGPVAEPRAITDADLDEDLFGRMRKDRTTAKMWGIREKRAREKAEEAAKKAASKKK